MIGNVAGHDVLLQAPRQLPPVHSGQLNVHQDERGVHILQHVECGHRVDRGDDGESVGLEQRARQREIRLVVIDNEIVRPLLRGSGPLLMGLLESRFFEFAAEVRSTFRV